MATLAKLSLLGLASGVSALFTGQHPLGAQEPAVSGFRCHLPPVLDPSADGLPSAQSLFTSHEALLKQVERHQAIVRVPSVSYDDLKDVGEDKRWETFYELHKVLEKTYPVLHKKAKVEKVNTLGLVYTIQGSNKDLKPILLAAHQDVVPVADASTWTHPPFDAYYDGKYLWGRGSSDDKNSLTAILSAVETLLSDSKFSATRTLVLAFGFDEECGGVRGAGSISKVLEERYGKNGIDLILDEGGLGLQSLGKDALYALPAVTEKEAFDIWFELHVKGGHSSIPFPHTGIGIIAEIVSALEAHPYSPVILEDSPVYNHLVCQARYSEDEVPWVKDLLHKGDLEELAKEVAETSPIARFLIQTSQAVDIIKGGQKINAMPEVISLGVNYRIAPHENAAVVKRNVLEYIQPVVEKYQITVKPFGEKSYQPHLASSDKVDYNATLVLKGSDGSLQAPVSPTSGPVWDVFSGTVQHTFKFDGTVVPVGQIMTGNTDTRHYWNLSPHIYRWTPSRERGTDNIHTVDERVDMESHLEFVRFYYDLVRNFNAAG